MKEFTKTLGKTAALYAVGGLALTLSFGIANAVISKTEEAIENIKERRAERKAKKEAEKETTEAAE